MKVVHAVVACLVNQLHHPQLSRPRADEITSWFHEVTQEEVELAMRHLEGENRIPPASEPKDGGSGTSAAG